MTPQPRLFGDSDNAAILSPDGLYRYTLRRAANVCADDVVNFVMLNPSVADHEIDDPTIRRCVGYARSWGYGNLVVTNLFAYRATDPKSLASAADPIGPENDRHIVEQARLASALICAWGCTDGPVKVRDRAAEVVRILRSEGIRLNYLRMAKCGQPSHPLYLPADLLTTEWEADRDDR